MYKFLRFTIWILFLLYMLQYMVSIARGYWIIRELDGTVRNDRYNLEFGYNVLFPVAFFGGVLSAVKKDIFNTISAWSGNDFYRWFTGRYHLDSCYVSTDATIQVE